MGLYCVFDGLSRAGVGVAGPASAELLSGTCPTPTRRQPAVFCVTWASKWGLQLFPEVLCVELPHRASELPVGTQARVLNPEAVTKNPNHPVVKRLGYGCSPRPAQNPLQRPV